MNMLAAIDLGGTHCRFARFAATPRGLDLEAVETCPTAGLRDSDAVLQQWESCLHTSLSRVAALVMGVAGPVQDGLRARLSNAPLRIDLNAVMPHFGLRRARVVNDFVCEACACLTRVGERSLHLLGPADIPCPSHRSPGEAPAPGPAGGRRAAVLVAPAVRVWASGLCLSGAGRRGLRGLCP